MQPQRDSSRDNALGNARARAAQQAQQAQQGAEEEVVSREEQYMSLSDTEKSIPTVDELLAEAESSGVLDAIEEIATSGNSEEVNAQLEQVRQLTEELGEMGAIEQLRFGFDIQKELVEHQKKTITDVEDTAISEIKRLSAEQLQKMENMQIGDLELSWWNDVLYKVFPKKADQWLTKIKEKFENVSDVINEINESLAEEQLKLEKDIQRVDNHIAGMRDLVNILSVRIGASQLYYHLKQKARDKYQNELKKKGDKITRHDTERLSGLNGELARMSSRISDMKGFRVKCFKSSKRQLIVRDAYLNIINSLQSLQTDTQLSFQIGIQEATSAHRMKQGADAVDTARSFTETLTEQTETMVNREAKRVGNQIKTGNQSLEKMRKSVEKTVKLAKEMRDVYEISKRNHEEEAKAKQELEKALIETAVANGDLETLELPSRDEDQ